MRPRCQADADFNHKIVLGLRRREPVVDIMGAHEGGGGGVPDPEVAASRLLSRLVRSASKLMDSTLPVSAPARTWNLSEMWTECGPVTQAARLHVLKQLE